MWSRLRNLPWVQKILVFMTVLGPGLITANIDNDAGGIATYSAAGAHTGMRLLWVIFPITLALILMQQMSARLGIVSGKGLADLIREKFGLSVTFYTFIFLVMADLGNTMAEFAGMAAASELFGISKYYTVPICGLLVWLLILKGNYKIVEKIFMAGCLVYLSYIACGLIIGPDWHMVLQAISVPDPHLITPTDFPVIVGLIGTTITPWMQFYIQSSIVEKGLTVEHLGHSRIDIIAGCLIMFVVTIFIILCCATTLYPAGIEIASAADAAMALRPLAGIHSSTLFGIGLFNASFFAAALLPLATSYYVCEGLGFESGVDKTFHEAPQFFTIFTALIVISMVMVLLPQIGLFKILIWSQIINGILIPLILIFIVNLANDPQIMGNYTNSRLANWLAYTVILLIIVANSCLIYFEIGNLLLN